MSQIQKSELSISFWNLFFTKRTIIAEPLSSDPEDERVVIMEKRKEILIKVKQYINTYLNPANVNFHDRTQNCFVEPKSIPEILDELGIDEAVYERALNNSDDNDYQLHLSRPSNSCFVNNYLMLETR